MKINIHFLSAFCFILFSCKTNQVLVKFKNDSLGKFIYLYVDILGKAFKFENLKSGESTKFIKVDKTYSYCFIRAITEKDTILFLPVDYVGERLYINGKIIMKLTIQQRQDSIRGLYIKSKRLIF